jgi:hypothetical protein
VERDIQLRSRQRRQITASHFRPTYGGGPFNMGRSPKLSDLGVSVIAQPELEGGLEMVAKASSIAAAMRRSPRASPGTFAPRSTARTKRFQSREREGAVTPLRAVHSILSAHLTPSLPVHSILSAHMTLSRDSDGAITPRPTPHSPCW